jgi:CheY-like chemotaxis protein
MDTGASAKRILVIDDDPIVREIICVSLEFLGYETIMAENGEVGVEIFRREKPLIVFTDLMFPGMDGTQVIKAVRSLHPQTFIVAVSGQSSPKVSSDAILSKPFTHSELKKVLEQASTHLAMQQNN